MSKQPIDCEQALRQIFEFIDHELDERRQEAMSQHLHTCKSCFSRMEFEQRLKEKVGSLRDEQATTAVSDRIKSLLRGF